MTWQPIETAPRDGATVRVGIASFFGMAPEYPVRARWDGYQWVFSADDHLDGRPFEPQPTLWEATNDR